MTTSEALKPVVTLVNAHLQDYREILAEKSERSLERAQKQRELDVLLLQAGNYTGHEANAQFFLSLLKPFEDLHLLRWHDRRFQNFLEILDIVQIFEKDGVAALNQRIADITHEMKEVSPDDEKAIKEYLHLLNDILFLAIYVCPHVARSVEIKLDRPAGARRFRDLVEYDYAQHRNAYDNLVALGETCGKNINFNDSLVLPLPYSFTTGTHESGERSAGAGPGAEIFFSHVQPLEN